MRALVVEVEVLVEVFLHLVESVERVGVDESAYGNTRLYTGREWLPALGHYDYRQRVYDPANGRFLTTDPIGAYGDPNNLGNPYTYVGSNPGSFVDPFGEERWGAQSYFADVADVGYGYFVGGAAAAIAGAATAIMHPIQTAQQVASLAGGLYSDFSGTAGGMAGSFVAQFQDSDTAGQAAFGAATTVVPGVIGAAKVATRVGRSGRVAEGVAAVAGDAVEATASEASSSPKLIKPTYQYEFDFGEPAEPSSPGAFEVGLYKDIAGTLPGYEAHHVGQKAVMKILVPDYEPSKAPAILVPKDGHTQRGVRGLISRDPTGLTSARSLVARDVMEMKRVYPNAPNAKLQELINLNKQL